jgi:hypothetical protein
VPPGAVVDPNAPPGPYPAVVPPVSPR